MLHTYVIRRNLWLLGQEWMVVWQEWTGREVMVVRIWVAAAKVVGEGQTGHIS